MSCLGRQLNACQIESEIYFWNHCFFKALEWPIVLAHCRHFSRTLFDFEAHKCLSTHNSSNDNENNFLNHSEHCWMSSTHNTHTQVTHAGHFQLFNSFFTTHFHCHTAYANKRIQKPTSITIPFTCGDCRFTEFSYSLQFLSSSSSSSFSYFAYVRLFQRSIEKNEIIKKTIKTINTQWNNNNKNAHT